MGFGFFAGRACEKFHKDNGGRCAGRQSFSFALSLPFDGSHRGPRELNEERSPHGGRTPRALNSARGRCDARSRRLRPKLGVEPRASSEEQPRVGVGPHAH